MLQRVVSGEILTPTDVWPYLAEINHRTMNEYTVLVSMVRRAVAKVTDPAAKEVLNLVDTRLRATACAHRALCPPHDSPPRNFDEQLQIICAALSGSLLGDRDVRLALFCEPIALDPLRCWQAALIVSELITNAAKHAFVEERPGSIVVDARTKNDEVWCTVSDDGAAERSWMPGFGSGVVDTLAVNLGGKVVRRHSQSGSKITLCFPQFDAVSHGRT